ncbi:hypothetical protein [Acuticoccus mangrovi]|uniref:Uncharacterized protein n=1 Tax=Acuticoccus mangrovi TaxID=2796142 RepID=A0A934ISR5_9HYPH|nr:hypothetical protein [Acuticoccus mangrovi]MBJ3777345.1 hypothetical protein [Acuticoccus mangrovi]
MVQRNHQARDNNIECTGAAESINIRAEGLTRPEREKAIKGELRAAYFRSISGVFVVLIGVFLIFLGIGDVVDFGFEAPALVTKITNSSPGLVIIIIGAVLILTGSPNINIK